MLKIKTVSIVSQWMMLIVNIILYSFEVNLITNTPADSNMRSDTWSDKWWSDMTEFNKFFIMYIWCPFMRFLRILESLEMFQESKTPASPEILHDMVELPWKGRSAVFSPGNTIMSCFNTVFISISLMMQSTIF